jgi:uncharacterized protein YjbI with pentapeptide repeats|tara:strand:+ start:2704 stop:4584 length:1881 start_codon:yes stop_codon:yes gene_type:complete
LKKIIIPIISISIILFGIEGYVNYSIAELDVCGLEKHEIFKELPQDIKKQRCQEIFGLGYVFDRVKQSTEVIHTNSDGFRGPEVTLEKTENAYRIFMVGGSTTYGDGIEDSGTMPFFLQQKFDEMDLGFNVQVINAGIPKAFSEGEVKLIKNRLLQYEPDLFVVYDGWNDSAYHQEGITDENKWFDRWKEICNLGKDEGFDVIVTIQPLTGTGNRVLTQQEYESYLLTKTEIKLTEVYPLYLEKLHVLNDYCTKTADLRGIFDNVFEPIYYDNGHQGARGSQIIAENIFKLISPVVTGNYETTEDNIEPTTTKPFYKTPSFISHMSSVEHFISTMPEKLDWRQDSFLYKNYSGSDLRNSILWDAENIKSYFAWTNLTNANLSGVDLSGWDLRGATLEGADLSYANLDNTKLVFANLNHAKLEGVNWKPDNNLRTVHMEYTDLSGLDFSSLGLTGSNLSNSNLTNTIFHYAKLPGVVFINSDLTGADFSGARLVLGVNEIIIHDDGNEEVRGQFMTSIEDVFSFKQVQTPVFTGSDLTNANLSNNILAYIQFDNVNAENVDFSDSVLVHTKLQNANLKNANFQNSYLYKTNFTNADLSGADFSGAEILDNVIFNGAILDCINHPICN